MNQQLVTKGNGAAVHVAYVYDGQMAGRLATLCDKWGSNGVYGSRIRISTAQQATCKSCMKIAGTA